MQRTNLARRYAPLAALAAVQLLIILLVPSKAHTATALETTGSGSPTQQAGGTDAITPGGDVGGTDLGPGTATTTGSGSSGTPGATGTGGSSGTGTGASTGSRTTGGGGGTGTATTAPAGGDTSHCVGGRQFDPKIDPSAPACTPKFTGNNGGATYKGVTADKIKVVVYYGKGSDAVNTILKAQNAYVSFDEEKDWLTTVQTFMNAHYETYGRKFDIELFQGTCETIPPDYGCLRNEVRQIISSKNPYYITWNTSVASPFFAEAAADKVPVAGGWHFSQKFQNTWKPFYYDVQIDGTTIAQLAADYACKELNGFKAKYAGDATLQASVRKFGLISPDDTENKAAGDLFKSLFASQCNGVVAAEYYYAQDISTAGQQTAAYIAKMRQASVTTEICLTCDLVAPQIGQAAEDGQQYYPERFLTGSGYMDADAAGQSYQAKTWKNGFGFSQLGLQEDPSSNVAARTWQASGRTGAPFKSAAQSLEYLTMIAQLVQATGPNLTPTNMYNAAQKMAPIKGDFATLSFAGGRTTWHSDVSRVYWDPNKASTYNGKPGTSVNMDGRRYVPGQFPAGELNKPLFP